MHPLRCCSLIVLFAAATLPSLHAAEPAATEPGFTALFNGRDFTGWKAVVKPGAENPFSVVEGVIRAQGKGAKLFSEGEYENFELRLEFRFVEEASDSGVFFRMKAPVGYQVQTKPYSSVKGLGEIRGGKRDETFERVHDIDAVKKAIKPTGEWQSYTIIAQGPHAEVWLNGEEVCTADGIQSVAGSIGLQAEYGQLEFRKIRIKSLPEVAKP